jgi:lipopolysaccharide heptosyltransferase II
MKYLVLRFSSLGDCVLLLPVLKAMKENGAEEVAVVTKEQYKELLASARGVDHVIALGRRAGPTTLFRLATFLREAGYEILDAHNSLRSRLLSALAGGAARRIEKHYLARTALLLWKKHVEIPNMRERYARLLDGDIEGPIPPPGKDLISISPRVEEKVKESLAGMRERFIAVAPGSRWNEKRWAAENFARLAGRIASDHGYDIIVLGDDGDAEAGKTVAKSLGRRALDLTGKTGILETACYLKASECLICNDSGLLHLAEAVGTPVLALFGPTTEEFGYYPSLPASKTCERIIPCRPCSRNGSRPCMLGTSECLAGIDVDAVEEVFRDLVLGRGPSRYYLP